MTKTTEEIGWKCFEHRKDENALWGIFPVKNIDNKRWWSEEEIQKAIKRALNKGEHISYLIKELERGEK